MDKVFLVLGFFMNLLCLYFYTKRDSEMYGVTGGYDNITLYSIVYFWNKVLDSYLIMYYTLCVGGTMNRRKYDIENKKLHEKLWDKWALEAAIFWAAQQLEKSQVDNTVIYIDFKSEEKKVA